MIDDADREVERILAMTEEELRADIAARGLADQDRGSATLASCQDIGADAARRRKLLKGVISMNQDQFLGMFRIIVPTATAWAIGKGYVGAGVAGDISAAILAIISAAWSYGAHTDSAKIAAVTALPDVKKIEVARNAMNPDVKAASLDSAQPKVAPAP